MFILVKRIGTIILVKFRKRLSIIVLVFLGSVFRTPIFRGDSLDTTIIFKAGTKKIIRKIVYKNA
ncbi:Uncharacterised protein [Streptococcus pneumoniae]|nr:hypothetical protein AZJ18_01825 [Streptococcus pneumoniae]CGE75361.1 Uncharacterised protein [Streptococcus pneumoniae]CIP87254.1 Uncharacterised protein [Streptococcus pneumoniae]COA42413.1 Uncharacterised protein [Streptococcus pneumoniae]COF61483.1 Uncharacterised protein [Streptococcus pneumoniae]